MIIRKHTQGETQSSAVYSDCESYRYALTRSWEPENPRVLFVMLNPSKATEIQNDPTVERCERRARALGYGAFRVVNIFAWRETNPLLMRKAIDPIGPDNDQTLLDSVDWADQIVAAWGTHGAHLNRGPAVAELLWETGKPISNLGLTKHGHPKHPLYIRYTQLPERWPR
ncbi:DUF1643 domain-containing protein [Yoonia sp. I 8.24]|uniref:DUF1643 domain-containing protein n=1 Tax=Yoonia sp. I 8.24 TaxID=1537229 RepID=UPI001EE10B1C|nr:DUF1643 domain-containing protein [Yoonia sp. I 8.24]MCG3268603.1 DUF1643 domain-containing protein [Yoonia sp. I 8.24]